jgi:hypothetical protein
MRRAACRFQPAQSAGRNSCKGETELCITALLLLFCMYVLSVEYCKPVLMPCPLARNYLLLLSGEGTGYIASSSCVCYRR